MQRTLYSHTTCPFIYVYRSDFCTNQGCQSFFQVKHLSAGHAALGAEIKKTILSLGLGNSSSYAALCRTH
jgi:hypothetical protein